MGNFCLNIRLYNLKPCCIETVKTDNGEHHTLGDTLTCECGQLIRVCRDMDAEEYGANAVPFSWQWVKA